MINYRHAYEFEQEYSAG